MAACLVYQEQCHRRYRSLVDQSDQGLFGTQNGQQHQNAVYEDSAYRLTQIVQSHIHKVIHLYKINITEIIWISRYHATQRVVHHFHDQCQRVFLLGDACHTHIPKAGQGMNVTSVLDAYNLTWKLALVMKGVARPSLLLTYEKERLWIAQQLIEFGAHFARQFGQKNKLESQNLRYTWEEGHGFTSGCGYEYPASLLVDPVIRAVEINDGALEPLKPGKRLLPINLVRDVDGTHVRLLDVMPSNGRFHLFIFAGKQPLSPKAKMLAESLNSPQSPLNLFNRLPVDLMPRFRHEDITTDSIPEDNTKQYITSIDLFVHFSDHFGMSLEDLPAPISTHWPMRVYSDIDGAGHKYYVVVATRHS